jgi:hypothetical protein
MDQKLEEETKKWLIKAKDKRKTIILVDKSRQDILKNIDAYISDSEHFMNKGDLIRSFEAIIWSWSIIELGLEYGFLKQSAKQ